MNFRRGLLRVIGNFKMFNKLVAHIFRITTMDFVYIALLLSVTTLYVLFYWNVPLSEDSGYYAFLSKEIQFGMIPHQDTPLTTNNILVYVTAGLFKLFGVSKFLFRLIYSLGYILLITTCYKLVRYSHKEHQAFLASLLAAILIAIPSISLDLGRNAIIWCLNFILIGLYFKLYHKNNYAFGFCLAIASLIRETFACILIFYGLISLTKILINFRNYKIYKHLFKFILGACIAYTINIFLLSYYHNWESYFHDMLHSGTSFRYDHGFLSLKRLKLNIKHLVGINNGVNYFHLYLNVMVVFTVLSYILFPRNNRLNTPLIKWIKFFFIPIFIFEAMFVNKTESYHIIPLAVACSMLVGCFAWPIIEKAYTQLKCSYLHRNTFNETKAKFRFFAKRVLSVIFLLYLILYIPLQIYNISKDYMNFYNNSVASNLALKNRVTDRALNVICNLPNTDQISTHSMYPLIFELKRHINYQYPYMYDTSLPANMNNSQIAKDQIFEFSIQKPDIIVLKTTAGYFPKTNDFQKPIDSNYITITDFDFSSNSVIQPYKNRIYISNKFFKKNYFLSQRLFFQPQINNPSNEAFIVKLTTQPAHCIMSYELVNEASKIFYDKNDYIHQVMHSLVLPHTSLAINKVNSCKGTPNPRVSIDIYKKYAFAYI